ncbi:SAF domain-containing protein [Paenibacillus septentrionalis]|uniref:SAF domain-containing protein n=1 Tax=Paenibacillus septentrionalis TaxID=429342 RepID=A0ABW1V8W3_9BACL
MAVRRNKKLLRYTLISGTVVAVFTSSVWFLSYRHYNAKLVEERSQFSIQLMEKNQELEKYQDQSKRGYVLSTVKNAGQMLEESDIKEEILPVFAAPDNLIQSKEDIVGKYLKINASPGTAVTLEMVRDEEILDPSERIEETEYVKLPIKVKKDDVVDIRIVFPNGEDYIVISKKKLIDVDVVNQYSFFHNNEEEALLLQAALVDAYINYAELYMKVYVEPELQERPDPTYIPNSDVLTVIKSNPLIVDQAKWKLANDLRAAMEKRLAAYEDGEMFRIGAQAPAGSGVSNRKTGSTGATMEPSQGPSTSMSPDTNTIITDSESVSTGNETVLQPNWDNFSEDLTYDIDDTSDFSNAPLDEGDLLGGR